jgi:endonuclease/exonuclease/phosphatase family metal-dependent hydrolase
MRRFDLSGSARASLLAAAALLAACGSTDEVGPDPEITLNVETATLDELPAVGTDQTFDVATWNIEWFGNRENGPADEELQLANVAYFMGGLAIDAWAVQEVTSATHFATLVEQLDGYAGLLANDSSVIDGATYYSDFNDTEQKVGLVYRTDLITIDSARVILGEEDHAFAGRPPLKIHLSLTGTTIGTADELIVIVLHAKAGIDADDRTRRQTGAIALEAYLDARYPDRPVLVTGDFNDDLDTSIAGGESPYAVFLGDPDYRFVTESLSELGESSTVFFDDMIDHHLASDELAADYADGSAEVFPAGEYVAAYAESTSDHFPVVARFGTEVIQASGPVARSRLQWSGATTDRVDIYRDAALLLTTENDGRYLDQLPLPGGALVYRVCEAGSQRCSDEATAVF